MNHPAAPGQGLATLQRPNNNNDSDQPRRSDFPEAWFTAHPRLDTPSPDPNHRPPDDRKVKLGKSTSSPLYRLLPLRSTQSPTKTKAKKTLQLTNQINQKTALRILQERLPTLLQTPLPQEVLSPHITLHLFPSTHPHLPTVTGRVAYLAALWSSPIAWNRVPLVGNVRLEILSERMVDHPALQFPTPARVAAHSPGGGGSGNGGGGGGGVGSRPPGAMACGEQLIVRWRTVGGGGSSSSSSSGSGGWLSFVGNGKGRRGKAKESLAGGQSAGGGRGEDGEAGGEGRAGEGGAAAPADAREWRLDSEETSYKAPVGDAQPVGASNKEFTGLFIFDFDSEGRILSHTIEHVQEGGQWEKGVGAKVVGLTDWLLGGMRGGDTPCPAFARARLRKGR